MKAILTCGAKSQNLVLKLCDDGADIDDDDDYFIHLKSKSLNLYAKRLLRQVPLSPLSVCGTSQPRSANSVESVHCRSSSFVDC